MIVADPAAHTFTTNYPFLHWAIPGIFAAAVVAFEFLKDRPKARGEG